MSQLDTIESLLRLHIQLSTQGREKTQADIADALQVTNEIKAGVKGLSLLGKVLGWVGGIAAALAGIVGLWQLLAPPGVNGG
jgi:hypothetical protein